MDHSTLLKTAPAMLLLSLSVCAASASAQVLSGVPARPEAPRQLTMTASLRQTYDDNLLAQHLTTAVAPPAAEGFFPSGDINLQYIRRTRRATLTADGSTGLQYYPQLAGHMNRSHSATLGLEMPLGRRTRLRASDAVSMATYYTLTGVPGGIRASGEGAPGPQLLAPGIMSLISTNGGWEHQMEASVSRQVGRAGSLDGRYGFSQGAFGDVRTHQHVFGAGFTQPLTRDLGLVARYSSERVGHATAGPRVALHILDGGLSYARALGRSRRTALGFSTGSGLMTRGEAQRDYRFLMDMHLARTFWRSWTSAIAYRRGIVFMSVLDRVVPSDSVTASAGGGLGRRLNASVAGTYSRGSITDTGEVAGDGGLTTYSLATSAQFGLTRTMAVEARHHYYVHQFSQGIAVPSGIAPDMARQAVTLSLNVALPLVR